LFPYIVSKIETLNIFLILRVSNMKPKLINGFNYSFIMRRIISILSIVSILLVSFCISSTNDNNTTNNTQDFILLKDGDTINDDICIVRGIKNKILVFHETGCGACAIAIPRLKEIENELNMTFEYIDLATKEGVNKVQELKIAPYAVPTIIVNCKAYTGVRSKDEYKQIILEKA
jgi:thiol-disulfide isomerase/thioredoxin